MSKGPKGEFKSFNELPEDFIKGIEHFSKEEEIQAEVKANKRFSSPEEKEARRLERMKKKKVLGKANFSDPDEVLVREPDANNINAADLYFENETGTVNEVSPSEIANNTTPVEEEVNDHTDVVQGVDNSEDETPTKIKSTRSKAPENVGARAGGSSQRKKAAELLKAAQEKDPVLPKEKRPEEAIEGKVLQFDNELKEKDILEATTLDELLLKIDASEGIQGKYDYFDQGLLRSIIEKVRDGEYTIDYVTRTNKLRDKVFDLLGRPAHMAEPIPGAENNIETEATNTETEVVVEAPIEKTPDFSQPEDVTKRAGYQRMAIPSSRIKKMTPPPLPQSPKVQKNPIPVPPEKVVEKKAEEPKLTKFSDYGNLDEIKELDNNLTEARNNLVVAEEVLRVAEEKKRKNPFRRFVYNASKKAQAKYQGIEDSAWAAREKYRKLIDQKVESISFMRLEEVSQLRDDSPERQQYEEVNFKDVEKLLIKKIVDLEIVHGQDAKIPQDYDRAVENLREKSKYSKITFNNLLENKLLDEKEVGDLRKKVITKKIKAEVRDYVNSAEDLFL